jgi:hypothetical protein
MNIWKIIVLILILPFVTLAFIAISPIILLAEYSEMLSKMFDKIKDE